VFRKGDQLVMKYLATYDTNAGNSSVPKRTRNKVLKERIEGVRL